MPQSFAEELSSIPMSTHLGQSLERAHRFAREQSHRAVTLEHLLLALTEDAEAALILQSANIELGRLSTEVSGYLGRLPEDMRGDGVTEPRPDAELLRVLQAAASAAKQSRRRQIDGAIVLAAVVGDGKTPAAGLLKALGMTFEEAIRALQRANTKARLKPTPKPATATATPARADTKPAAPAEPPETAEPRHRAGIVRRRAGAIAVGRGHPGRRTRPHPAALGGRRRQAGARRRQGGAACTRAGEANRRRGGQPAARRAGRDRGLDRCHQGGHVRSDGARGGAGLAEGSRRGARTPAAAACPAYRPEADLDATSGAKAAAGTSRAAAATGPPATAIPGPARCGQRRAATPTAAAGGTAAAGLSQPAPARALARARRRRAPTPGQRQLRRGATCAPRTARGEGLRRRRAPADTPRRACWSRPCRAACASACRRRPRCASPATGSKA